MYGQFGRPSIVHLLTCRQSVPYPPGRTACGFKQKLKALKKALKPELDAINSGQGNTEAAAIVKRNGGRKRKVMDGDVASESEDSMKRGRTKKRQFDTEVDEIEVKVKDEPEGELESETEA